jgi:formate-dependent nitrite reductase membrane component NrfD
MIELTTTRANPMIDPHMHVWGWEIPVYLFLGGMVAGMMIISGFFLFTGRDRDSRCVCKVLPGVGLALLSIGMLALFLDLEHKPYFWRLYTTFEITSPMSWGSWILLLVYPALLANAVLSLPAPLAARWPALARASSSLRDKAASFTVIGVLNMLFGGMLGIYTGILLSALGARPLWNSAALGLLFLASGLSAAAAFGHLVARQPAERVVLAKGDNAFLALEILLLGLFLIGLTTSTAVHEEAARLFLGGPYTAVFWVGVVGLGVVIPLVIQLLAVNHKIQHTPIAPLMVMVGGVVLRFVIVSAGQFSHWSPP